MPGSRAPMKDGLRDGLIFGLTSGVITTLGLMVGLHAGTESFLAVIGGMITIAFADALSDAMGIHLSKEGDKTSSDADVWAATLATFFSKAITTLTFVVPLLLLDLDTGIIVSIVWGMTLLTALSWVIAHRQGANPLAVIAEHLAIAGLVITVTYYLGIWVKTTFAG